MHISCQIPHIRPIKLRDAPARFLKTDWLRLMDLKGSETNAIGALSHPDPGMLVYYRRQVIAAGRGGREAQAEEYIYALVEKMIASLRELGASGQIIGHGIYWTALRQPIPPELWPDLKFDFEANKASNDKFSYSHVTIDQDDPAGHQGDVVARIVAWLTQHRPENSKAPKKMLAADARAEFGSDYTERAFNEAYRDVYQHRRGRPRGSEK
jgi:hypothetical protein